MVFAGLSLAIHATLAVGAFRRATPREAETPTFDTHAEGLSGETLDVEPPAEPTDEAPPSDPGTPSPTTANLPVAPPLPGAGAQSHAAAAPPGGVAAAAKPALYGAVGVRYATDLATTFTRAFPQAASADGVWLTATPGASGVADVTMTIDDGGRLASSQIGGTPSPALRRGVERTLVLLGSRTFTARGAVTRLRVTAKVTPDDVHDGLHGDVYALSGGSFSGDLGTAFFTLPSRTGTGRRVDVQLRLLP